MPLKIVIDTNIWVSYFINSRADYLARWIIDHDVTIYTSEHLANEIEEVLNRPKFKKQFSFPIHDFIGLHLQICETLKANREYHIAPDPDDDFLFDLCNKAGAALLITSDKKLLSFSPPFPLKIITFNELRNRY
jgi:uncharacterized protein